ncbi:unnamed protein product [Brassicogethes aeneus]|uniref:Uncharacterized protein n=1 Tax=Brassicogethes aeneus TaxID=1431903 RepID=A0A9P0B615_BRAAE|nr:unnamed protein product [Brassicogethes aeneus]
MDMATLIKETIQGLLIDDAFITSLATKVNSKLEQKMNEMKEAIKHMEQKNLILELKINKIQQNEKNKNICIFGIKETTNENTTTVVNNLITENLNLTLNENAILNTFRTGKKNNKNARPIIVQFSTVTIKQNILKNKKLLKGKKAFIMEDLTKFNQEILKEAQEKLGGKNVWSQNGCIFTVFEEKLVRIDNLEKISKIMESGKEVENNA